MGIELKNLLDKPVLLLDTQYRCRLYSLYLKYRDDGMLGTMIADVPDKTKYESGQTEDLSRRVKMGDLTTMFMDTLTTKTTYLPRRHRGDDLCPLYSLNLDNKDLVRKNSIRNHMEKKAHTEIVTVTVDGTKIGVQGLKQNLEIKPLLPPQRPGICYIVSEYMFVAMSGIRNDLIYVSYTSPTLFDDSGMDDSETTHYINMRTKIGELQHTMKNTPGDMQGQIAYQLYALEDEYTRWHDEHLVDTPHCVVSGIIDDVPLELVPTFKGAITHESVSTV